MCSIMSLYTHHLRQQAWLNEPIRGPTEPAEQHGSGRIGEEKELKNTVSPMKLFAGHFVKYKAKLFLSLHQDEHSG